MAVFVTYRLLIHQMPRIAESMARRVITTRMLPPSCLNCRQFRVYNAPAESNLLDPAPRDRTIAVIPGHRLASSIPPRLDPDVERLQRSMKGMVRATPVQYDGDRLIYQVRAGNYIKIVMVTVYATAIAGLYMAPDMIVGAWESDILSWDNILNMAMLASGVFLMPTLMTFLARRIVLKMYHNEAKNTYLTVVSKNVLGLAKNRFDGSDVVGVPEFSFQRWFKLVAFRVRGRPYFVNPVHFQSPSDYNKLMHY